MMKITRKEFLGRLIKGAAGMAGAAMILGCSSDGGSADAHPTSCTMNGTTATIGSNHGHVLMVSKEDVTAGVVKTYDITGTASHAHSVTVTVAMFTTLQNNTSVMTTSTNNSNHAHDITVMCA
jgi:hypothetical protein